MSWGKPMMTSQLQPRGDELYAEVGEPTQDVSTGLMSSSFNNNKSIHSEPAPYATTALAMHNRHHNVSGFLVVLYSL